MLARSAIVLAVVTGGIALGAILGKAADPEMKQSPEEAWRSALRAPAPADVGYQLVDARDLNPYESHAPSWADEELTNWEPDYPAWTYSDFAGEFGEDLAALQTEEQQPVAPETVAPPADTLQPDLPPEPQIAGNLAALY